MIGGFDTLMPVIFKRSMLRLKNEKKGSIMKKTMLLAGIASVMIFSNAADAAEKVQLVSQKSALNSAGILRVANPAHRKLMEFLPNGGAEGGCYKVTQNAESRHATVVYWIKDSLMNITNTAAPVSLKLQVKGKGSFRLSFLCYNKAGRYFSPEINKTFRNIDTKGAWQTVEFVFTPSPKNARYLAEVASVTPAVCVESGEFLIDNWEAEVKNPAPGIKLED